VDLVLVTSILGLAPVLLLLLTAIVMELAFLATPIMTVVILMVLPLDQSPTNLTVILKTMSVSSIVLRMHTALIPVNLIVPLTEAVVLSASTIIIAHTLVLLEEVFYGETWKLPAPNVILRTTGVLLLNNVSLIVIVLVAPLLVPLLTQSVLLVPMIVTVEEALQPAMEACKGVWVVVPIPTVVLVPSVWLQTALVLHVHKTLTVVRVWPVITMNVFLRMRFLVAMRDYLVVIRLV
jgi:hypothetical protein